ncbi:chondroadherin-like [Anopheles stephensi]|uniref:chondroadherin-like n=1 Tax=Anopheles stephensi TaxID=30069 RepID=UPI001658BFEC|nr:chondroadherin-like [Anopheles stephensi]
MWNRVLFVLVAAQFGCSVHIVCDLEPGCDIYDMRSSADFFVHRYIPPTVQHVNYRHLAISCIDNAFFSTIPTFVTSVEIFTSKHIRWLIVPSESNMSSVNVAYTGLRRFDVERGSALSAVSVASSNLDEISPSVSYLEAAQDIAITSCLIESVDLGVFCNMAKLQLLNFYGNRIRYVKNSANSNCSLYDSLTTLTLSQNYLQSLNMGLLSPFRSLALLNVNENRVEAVFGSYETDANLTMFLQKNKIKSFDVCTWYVPRMHSLDLQHNQLSTVPNCLEKLNGVSQLILAFNQLSNVSIESFAKMESLVYLNLCCNSMTSISFNTTRYPISLRTVLLAENNLTALDLSLVAVPSLEVDVEKNFIETFDVRKVSANVTKLLMRNNPIDCSWKTREERAYSTCVKNIV